MKRLLFILMAIFSLVISVPALAGFEDFTTFTEVDTGTKISVDSATKISWNELNMAVDAYCYSDKGDAHFNDDWSILFEGQFSDTPGGWTVGWWLAITDVLDDAKGIFYADGEVQGVRYYNDGAPSDSIQIIYYHDQASSADTWAGPSASTTYYHTFERDYDGGVGNGQLVNYIRTGSHVGVLQDTLTLNLPAQDDLRYVMVPLTYNGGYVHDDEFDGFTENLDLNEAAGGIDMGVAGWFHLYHH